jgi:hypothetical protein
MLLPVYNIRSGSVPGIGLADPYNRSRSMRSCFHSDADPDPNFHWDADMDPKFHFDADPDPDFHSDADPDPLFPFDADQCGFGNGINGILAMRIRIQGQEN